MANEAVLMIETDIPIPFTVANTIAIPKGTLLTMSDPFTASGTTALGAVPAGIAKNEKIASDGKTTHGVYRGGIFKVVASGSVTTGDPLTSSTGGANQLEKAATNEEDVWGISLEDATDGQTFLFELRPTAMSLA